MGLAGRLHPRRRDRGRAGDRRRLQRRRARVVDGRSGGVADGARLRGPVRARAQRALRVAAALRDLPPRPRRLAPPVADRPPRPARAARLRRLARLLQPGRDRGLGATRLPGARLPAGEDALARVPRRRGAATRLSRGLARDRRRLSDRLPGDDQRRRLRGDRRRLRGNRGRGPDRPRPADLRRGRVPRGQPLRRHVRSRQLLRVRAVRARAAVERRVGRARRLPRRRDRVRPRHGRRAVRLRPAASPRTSRARARGDPRLRLGRIPVHGLRPAVELERLVDRRAARLVPGAVRAPAGARGPARARGGREVRAADAGAALRRRRPRAARAAPGARARADLGSRGSARWWAARRPSRRSSR